ncbi:MAG: amino acid permease [Oscillospiraceae bacterium]|nr:amino acid permease [Oscillospiraceae bacterium]
MEKKLTLMQLIWIGTGHVIGAGVVSITGNALTMTGYSVWLAFAVACILSFIRILPVVFFTSSVVADGGRYGMITGCVSKKCGGLVTLSSMLNWSARGTAVLALRGYIADYLPDTDGKTLTLAVWAFFCLANLYGVDMMSKIQGAATPLLLIALTVFSLVCMFNTQPGYLDFSSEYMFTNGAGGFFAAVVLLSYSCDGIASLANYSTKAENPRKTIPAAMVAVSVITTVIYIMVGYACGAVLPLEETAGATLTVTARYILSPLFYNLFIFFGPIFALITTMNAGIPDSALPVMAGVKEGWLPSFMAKQNRHGAYYVAIAIIFVIGALPTIMDFSVSQIAGITMVLNALASILMLVSSINFPFIFSKEWKESDYYLPLPAYMTIIFICAVIELFVVIKALAELTPSMVILNIILLAVCGIYGTIVSKITKV